MPDLSETLIAPDKDTWRAWLAEHGATRKEARRNFLSFPPSSRKQYLYWVSEAKREETRRRRIAEVVKRAEENRRTWS